MNLTPTVLVIIPARFASTRLPGKPLRLIGGVPMIVRVWRQAMRMNTATRVVVATDDPRIADAVTQAGGEAVMTRADHPSGTDRIAEVAARIEADIIVNVQGDEPFLDPEGVDAAVRGLVARPDVSVSTLVTPIGAEEAADKNVTKAVMAADGLALYFSKAPIPHDRDGDSPDRPLFKHLGVYVFRRDYLLRFASMAPTPLERCEKLEQLRILENGDKILCIKTAANSLGVDSEEDLRRAEAYLSETDN
ncbi:MAG: 3-deoxy-manno-octulosonate cytidylyltransferase [Nitrospinae bacterium]|nr:3-deoxy-manno-octulosonate cytidylyltransferase [Nitrospinota bacterium]